jgi:hypothetical protein
MADVFIENGPFLIDGSPYGFAQTPVLAGSFGLPSLLHERGAFTDHSLRFGNFSHRIHDNPSDFDNN